MCATCGCSKGAKATVLNLQTGETSALEHDHDHHEHGHHEHVHADGTRHSHSHGDEHDHGHDHDHDHGHIHAEAASSHGHASSHGGNEHVHADGTRHSHAHGDEHDHGHVHDHDHDHAHDHSHAHDHEHVHAEATSHSHSHTSSHGRHAHGPSSVVDLEARVLAKNDALAQRNRAWLAGREILMLNLVSSPGAGKTTLLERTIRDLKDRHAIFVVEGDQATANDAERIKNAGAPAVQVNTGTGCHLEADMIARGLAELRPSVGAIVLVENVGNLVCPALFDLGEAAKVAILSVAEGDDKPAKYPHMFAAASLVLINKIDLLPHVDFSVEKATAHARAVNPGVEVMTVSAKTGEGLDAWYVWLSAKRAAAGGVTAWD